MTAIVPTTKAEYHFGKGGHYLFDSGTWERVKAQVGTTDPPFGVGSLTSSLGTPVFVDECPCGVENGSTEQAR